MVEKVESPFHLIKKIEKLRAVASKVEPISGFPLEKVEHVKLTLRQPVQKDHVENLATAFHTYFTKLSKIRSYDIEDKSNEDAIEFVFKGAIKGYISFKTHPTDSHILLIHANYPFANKAGFHVSRFLEEHVSEELKKTVKWWHNPENSALKNKK